MIQWSSSRKIFRGVIDDAQEAFRYYRQLSVETETKYLRISKLLAKEHRTKSENATLEELQGEYSAFVSADYMMGKNLPFWGESPQLVHDLFGIIDYSRQGKKCNYVYLCDEAAAGSKTLDHTISALH